MQKHLFVQTVCLNLFIVVLLVFHRTLSEDTESCVAPEHEDGRFTMTGDGSKYVVLDRIYGRLKTYSEAKEVCESVNLEMAEITSHLDELHISRVFAGWNWTENRRWFWLGLTDSPREGKWYESDKRTPIRYQLFNSSEPDNSDPNKVEANNVIFLHSYDFWYMVEYRETFKASVFCQFKKKSMCFRKSFQTMANRKTKDKTLFIGKSEKRKFYITSKQKTWKDAFEYCKKEEMILLDLDFEETESKELYEMIQGWEKGQDLAYFTTTIWTSGRYANSFKDKEFTWKSTNTIFSHSNKKIKWEWDDGEPSDSSGKNLETCISIATLSTDDKDNKTLSTDNKDNKTLGTDKENKTLTENKTLNTDKENKMHSDNKTLSTGNKTTTFTFQASNCLIPRWVICYKTHTAKPTKKPKR